MREARVLVVGAGGLGAPLLAYLAAAGVGRIGVVDDDVVEASNLQRQVIHRETSVGTAKVASAAEFVAALNSDVQVVEHRLRLGEVNAFDVLAPYDVVVDGSDNFTTRYVVNDVCVALQLPLVWASISQFAGQLGVVSPMAGPCYRCAFPKPLGDDEVPDCATGGVLGVLPGVMGALQATEVIKLLTGVGEVADTAITVYDALTTSFGHVPLERDVNCVACGDGPTRPFSGLAVRSDARPALPPVREVEAHAVPALGACLVLDVREPVEIAARPAPADWGEVLAVPMSQWGPHTVDEVRDRADGRAVLTVCAAGSRSVRAAHTLQTQSTSGRPVAVASLAGGLAGLDE